MEIGIRSNRFQNSGVLFFLAFLLAIGFSLTFPWINFAFNVLAVFGLNFFNFYFFGTILRKIFQYKKLNFHLLFPFYLLAFLFSFLLFTSIIYFVFHYHLELETYVYFFIQFLLFVLFFQLKTTLNRAKKVYQEQNEFKLQEVEYKLNVLKEQLNPHFLFNSLNVLKSLISIDPEKAIKYTVDFAELLRITIDSEKKENTIKEELELCNLYLSIQNMRFNNNIFLNIALNSNEKGNKIPFLSLIILVENAIKHNIVSTQEKLFINLTIEDDYLVVKNNLNKKHHSLERKGIGLQSIDLRCHLLVKKGLEIIENKDYFSVKIPYKND